MELEVGKGKETEKEGGEVLPWPTASSGVCVACSSSINGMVALDSNDVFDCPGVDNTTAW